MTSVAPAGPWDARLYSSTQAAKVARCARKTMTTWLEKKMLRGYRVPGSRDWRVYEDDLVNFLLEHGMRVPAEMLARRVEQLKQGGGR